MTIEQFQELRTIYHNITVAKDNSDEKMLDKAITRLAEFLLDNTPRAR